MVLFVAETGARPATASSDFFGRNMPLDITSIGPGKGPLIFCVMSEKSLG